MKKKVEFLGKIISEFLNTIRFQNSYFESIISESVEPGFSVIT